MRTAVGADVTGSGVSRQLMAGPRSTPMARISCARIS